MGNAKRWYATVIHVLHDDGKAQYAQQGMAQKQKCGDVEIIAINIENDMHIGG